MNSKRSSFSSRVDQLVERCGGTKELSQRSKLSRRVLDKYRAGKSDPSRERLIAIADAAHVTVQWLATGEGPMAAEANAAQQTQFSHYPRATGDERSCITGEPEVGHRSPPINASGCPLADLPFCDPEFIMTARRRRMGDSAMTAMARAVVTNWLNAPHVQTAYADALAGRTPDDAMTPQYSAYRDMFDGWVASGTSLPNWQPNQPPPDFVIQSCLNILSFNHS